MLTNLVEWTTMKCRYEDTCIGLSPVAPPAPALWAEVKHVRALTRAVSMSQESAKPCGIRARFSSTSTAETRSTSRPNTA
jgi:hypothetical protein